MYFNIIYKQAFFLIVSDFLTQARITIPALLQRCRIRSSAGMCFSSILRTIFKQACAFKYSANTKKTQFEANF